MSKNKLLSIAEIHEMSLNDFLKQEPFTETNTDTNIDPEVDPEVDHETNPGNIPDNTSQQKDNPTDHYICQNESCQHKDFNYVHLFEMDSDEIIVICDKCYDNGYRFCLFTHEVIHLSQMDSVLGDMYAQPSYHQNQLNPEIINTIPDLYQYLHMIGIDNPNPDHSIIEIMKN